MFNHQKKLNIQSMLLILAALLLFGFFLPANTFAKDHNQHDYSVSVNVSAEHLVVDLTPDEPDNTDLHLHPKTNNQASIAELNVETNIGNQPYSTTINVKKARAPPVN